MSSLVVLMWLATSLAPIITAYSGKVLLVSMDGFRWDYSDQVETPNFDDFAKHGVILPYMDTSFVTKTFPTHFTMATGLHAESHGITDSFMYDPVFDNFFNLRTKEPRWWNGGEPIWVTAKNQGLKTGTYYWPGSEIEIRGVRPDYWFQYSNDPPFTERVDTVMDWFKNRNVNMATMYFHEPDSTGHRFGPDSPEVRAKVKEMDDVLGYLVEQMKVNGLDDEVNVIVTSDHGMTRVDNVRRIVDISDYVDMAMVKRVPSEGALLQIQPVEGQEDAIVQALSGVSHIKVYKKEDIPSRLHYKNNRRIMPIIVMAEEGWLVTTNKTRQARSPRIGMHGYDNRLMSMKPIFLARGPDFKTNFFSDPISIVDIYPLVCKLLNITPSPNNGSLERVSSILRQDDNTPYTFSRDSEIMNVIRPIINCFGLC